LEIRGNGTAQRGAKYINLLQVESLRKSKLIFRRETPKTPRFAEKDFSANLGDFGEVRRIKLFLQRGFLCRGEQFFGFHSLLFFS
jgi:hypothetical protein